MAKTTNGCYAINTKLLNIEKGEKYGNIYRMKIDYILTDANRCD